MDTMKIRFEYTNLYGEKFVTEREVPEDFLEMTEVEILHDTYKNFLNNLTFPVDTYDEVTILRKGEHICHCNDDELDGGYK